MKAQLMGFIKGIFPIQVMAHHKAYVREKALNNKHVSYDTFVLPSDVRNLTKKRNDELRIPLVLECGFWKTLI